MLSCCVSFSHSLSLFYLQDYKTTNHTPQCPLQTGWGDSLKVENDEDYMNYGSNNLIHTHLVSKNSTSAVVRTTLQFMAHMGSERDKYLLTLRNPTDRLVLLLSHNLTDLVVTLDTISTCLIDRHDGPQ